MDKRKIDKLENALKGAYSQKTDADFTASADWQENLMGRIKALPRNNSGNEIIYEQFILKAAWSALGVAAAFAVIMILALLLFFSSSSQSNSLDSLITDKSIQISYGQFANSSSGGA
jgi:hypothetical protein